MVKKTFFSSDKRIVKVELLFDCESGVVLKMLRILEKALAKLRYRAGCHRYGHIIILNTHPALRPSLLVEKESFKIKIYFMGNFLTFQSFTNPFEASYSPVYSLS